MLLFSGTDVSYSTLPCGANTLELGRGVVGHVRIDDACMSRRHARVTHDDAGWRIEDLGNREGWSVG